MRRKLLLSKFLVLLILITGSVGVASAQIAKIGDNSYSTLAEAIKAAAPAGTVELLSDVTIDKWIMFSETLNIGSGQIITMDINGLTIDGKNHSLTIKSIESASNGNRLFYDATNLNIKDLTINCIDAAANQGGIGLTSGTIENVIFNGGGYAIFPGTGVVTIKGCTFKTNSTSIYYEDERDYLVVTGNTFENPDNVNVILLRGKTKFTGNTVVSGRTVNVVSGSPEVTGNDFNEVRFKVYNAATATISGNTINNLVFNETDVPTESTFTGNTLSAAAQAAIDALPALAGEGTEANPYTISNLAQLKAFRDDVNAGNNYAGKYVALTADIDLNNEEWTPIGNSSKPFEGTFDGNNKTIHNVYAVGNGDMGFFGQVARQTENVTGTVKNITFNNVTIIGQGSSQPRAGVIAVAPMGARINNVKLTGEVTIQGYRGVGGIVGNGFPIMDECSVIAEGTITATYWGAGGILGFSSDKGAKVTNSVVQGVGEGLTIHGNSGGVGAVSGSPHGAKVDGAEITDVSITSNNNYCMGYVDAGGNVNNVNVTDVKILVSGVEIIGVDAIASIDNTPYFSLQDALNAGGNVTILSNITLAEGVTVAEGKTVVLDLNGKTISQTKAQTAGYQMILNDGNLTINDSSEGKTGKISYTDSGNGGEYISDVIYNRATLVINGGTIENLSSATVATNGYPHAVDTYSGIRNTSVTINGGTIYCAEYSAVRMFCVSATNTADLVIKDGTIKGAVDMQNGTKDSALGTLTIENGTFETTKNANNIRFANWNSGATEYGISAEIKGGSFDGGITAQYVPAAANWDKGVISGGTFTNEVPAEFLVPGYVLEQNQDGTYGVVVDPAYGMVAQIGDVYYETLADAHIAATDGQTITLLDNITLSEIFVIEKSITFNGNGKTLTSTAGRAINVSGADGVTIKNLTINASGERAINVIQNATNVTIDGVIATAANYTVNVAGSATAAVVAINNSTLNGLCTVNVAAAGSQVTVDKSTVNCNDNNTTAGESYAALCLNKDAVGGSIVATNSTINVTEGSDSMKGRNGAENGTVTINGSTDGVAVMVAAITYEGSNYYYSFETLAAAIEFAKAGNVVSLIRDVEINELVEIEKAITLDLNGKTVTANCKKAFEVSANATIKNGTISSQQRCVDTRKAVKLTLENLILNAIEYYSAWGNQQPLTIGGEENGTIVNMTNVDINAGDVNQNPRNYQGYGIITFVESTINIDYCDILGYMAIYLKEGSDNSVININNSTLTTDITGNDVVGNNTSVIYYENVNNVEIEITNSSLVKAVGDNMFIIGIKGDDNSITIGQGCNIEANDGNIIHSITEFDSNTIILPAAYAEQLIAEGYVVTEANGLIKVSGLAVAKIGETLYATVTEAINAADDGATIQLLPVTINEYVAPWATDTQHTSEKSITIIGAENFGTTMTGGLYLGYDNSQCREHTIVVKGINFTGKGILVASQQNVIVEGNKFTDITDRVASSGSSDKNAISIIGKDVIATVKNNVITTTASVGIDLRNILTATVDGNTVTGTQHNSMQIQNASANSSAEIANNRFFDWGKSGEGRAMRINQIVTADVNNNVMINVNAPEEFVKITEHTTAEIDENYWNGANPASSNTPAYFLAEGVQVHNYYAAYNEETNTLSDLVTIEGAGETLEIFYTAAGEVTEQANAAYSLMFTVTDYANNKVSVKIGSKNPNENKGCDLLIPSSVKFNDQDFAVTSIPDNGFKECKGFDKLVVPGTITSVSNSAFYNCSKLTEVVIKEGVQKLGSETFYKITNLQTLTLPSTLTRIESLCFNGTHNIETIVCNAQTPPTAFNASFTDAVSKNALLYVDGKYEDYKAANGWSNFKNILAVGATQTIDKDRYTLIATITDVWNRTCSVQIGTAPTNTKRAELAIPEHVSFSGIEFDITSIPESGFQDCKYFEGTLTIPAYITSIGGYAFEGCSGVTALVVEEGVTSLGTSNTFNGCRNIETITLPSTLTKIPAGCFYNILQKLQVVECHALVPPTFASQFTQEAYNSATLYVHDVDAYKGANNWKLFKSIRLIGAVAQNKETEVEYKSIAEAVAAANAGETVQMLQNVDLENTITVAADKEVVLDLNGKTVSYTTKEHKGEAMITNNGNLTITDSAEGGKLSYAYEGGADPLYSFGNSTIENKGVLTINAGTVQNTSEAMSHASYAINTGAGATLNVEGGNILNLDGHAVRMVSFGTTLNTVNIEGGYIEGTRALQVQLPGSASSTTKPAMDLNITGGKLMSNEETYNLAIYVYSGGQSAEDLTIKIEGGTFNGNVAIYEPSVTMEANSVVVSGGTFNGAYGIYTYGKTEADQAVISIVGGTFETNYSEWWATDDNYVFEQNENGTYSVVEQTIFTQTTQLNAGWNWFSAYVDIEGVHYEDEQAVYEGLTMIQNALGTNGIQIKKQGDFSTYYKDLEAWFGDFAIYNKETLFINVTESQELTIVGEIVNPEDHTITLNPNWTWIGYPLNVTMSMSEAFELAGLEPNDGDIVKCQNEFASYIIIDENTKGWIGDFYMNPGEGFMYMNNSTSSNQLTYKYPTNSNNRSETRANVTTEVNHWTPNASQYPNNMTMMAMVDIEGGDYEVAAFVDGEVRGSARPIYVEALDSYMLFLTIHGEGVEEMTFKFYDLTTGEEFDLNDRMNYSDNAIVGSIKEPYMFNRGTTGIGEASLSDINIYPNPTTTGKEINLQATCDKVEVFNALGVKVAEYQNVDSIDAIETAGIYVIRITNNGNVQNCRLVVK